MKSQVEKMIYEAPMVEIIEVEVEKGFATSNTVNSSNINGLEEEIWN